MTQARWYTPCCFRNIKISFHEITAQYSGTTDSKNSRSHMTQTQTQKYHTASPAPRRLQGIEGPYWGTDTYAALPDLQQI